MSQGRKARKGKKSETSHPRAPAEDATRSAPPPPRPWRTLLLNLGYEPLLVISWQRAVSLWCVDKVHLVEVYPEVRIHSPSITLPVPAVVRLQTYVRYQPSGVAFNRKNVFLRDDFRCQYCRIWGDGSSLTLDHVVPRAQGGMTRWDNIVTCCVQCNRAKGSRTPEQAGMMLQARPRRPSWLLNTRIGPHPTDPPAEWQLYLRAA